MVSGRSRYNLVELHLFCNGFGEAGTQEDDARLLFFLCFVMVFWYVFGSGQHWLTAGRTYLTAGGTCVDCWRVLGLRLGFKALRFRLQVYVSAPGRGGGVAKTFAA